jgi:hypothetical protein
MQTQDRTPTTSTIPARTANHHYAQMRCAEDTARRLSSDIVAHNTLATMTGIAWDDQADRVAVRDSYYLLAAAHRAGAHRIERRSRRALAWSDFKANPVMETYWKAGDVARLVRRKASRLARSIRRMVTA